MSATLLRRHAATEKTRLKYVRTTLDWRRHDCVRMLRSHLVAMGHRGLPKIPRYGSLRGARRALDASGYASIEAMIDAILPRIEPAEALPGDVVLLQGADESGERPGALDAVTICVGRKVMGWAMVGGVWRFSMLTPLAYKAAWRAGATP